MIIAALVWLLLPRDARLGASTSLFWLLAALITGDRRLFFPFTIQLALNLNPARAALVVAAFLLIRVVQDATLKVLAVELAVAVFVAALALSAYARSSRTPQARFVWSAAGSLLAFLGLAF